LQPSGEGVVRAKIGKLVWTATGVLVCLVVAAASLVPAAIATIDFLDHGGFDYTPYPAVVGEDYLIARFADGQVRGWSPSTTTTDVAILFTDGKYAMTHWVMEPCMALALPAASAGSAAPDSDRDLVPFPCHHRPTILGPTLEKYAGLRDDAVGAHVFGQIETMGKESERFAKMLIFAAVTAALWGLGLYCVRASRDNER
jgi:hypothetical protein